MERTSTGCWARRTAARSLRASQNEYGQGSSGRLHRRPVLESFLSDLVSYELQTYSAGVWKIDSIYDDREIAVYEAQRLHATHRFSAVRVVEEKFDSAAGKSVTKTVFRAAKTEAENVQAIERQKTAREEVQTARKSAGVGELNPNAPPAQAQPKNAGLGAVPLILILAGIILAGIGILIGVQILFGVRL